MADEGRGGFWSNLVERFRGEPSPGRQTQSGRDASANPATPTQPAPAAPPAPSRTLPIYEPSERSLPKPPEGFRKPSAADLDRAIQTVAERAGIDANEAKSVARSFGSADWSWHFADHSDNRRWGQESVDKALKEIGDFAGKSRAHAEIASSIADNRHNDLALVGRWYVRREDRDPALVRELVDQKALHSMESNRRAGDAPRGAERLDPDREVARSFRQLSQSERLQDSRMNAGAKTVAALDAAIERKYGASTPEAHRMKRAARESVAQTLERGGPIRVPRVREDDRKREDAREQGRTQDRDAKERDR